MLKPLSECKAEIMRRSKQRIHRRKKQVMGLLACCVPLLLGVTIWFGFANWPQSFVEESYEHSRPSNVSVPHESKTNYTTMVVSHNQTVQIQENNRHKIVAIQTELESIMNGQPSQSSSISHAKPGAPVSSSEPVKSNTYWITFSNPKGQQQVYAITGNQLVDHTTNRMVALSPQQLKKLLVDLSLANPK